MYGRQQQTQLWHIEELKKEDKTVYDWLISKPSTHYSKVYFQTELKCAMLLNNLCESFNNVIIRAKINIQDKTIIYFVNVDQMLLFE